MTEPFRYSCPYCYAKVGRLPAGASALEALSLHIKTVHGDRVAEATPFKVAFQVQAATNAVAAGAQGGLR